MLSLVSHVAKKNAAVMGYTDDKKVSSERVKLKEANTHSIFSFFFYRLNVLTIESYFSGMNVKPLR